jgi:outer membrane autotransporter protein
MINRKERLFSRVQHCGVIFQNRWLTLRFAFWKILVFLLMLFSFSPLIHADQLSPNPNNGTINVSGNDWNSQNPFANNGTLDINTGGTLINNSSGRFINNGMLTNYWGTLTNNGTFVNNGTLTNNWGLCIFTNNGTLTNNHSLINYQTLTNNAVLTNNGILTNNDNLFNLGTFFNNDTLQNGSILYNIGTFFNSGVFNSNSVINNSGMFYNYGSLAINSLSFFVNWTDGTLNNFGTFSVPFGGTPINFGTINNYGIFLLNSGMFDNYNILTNYSILTNYGTLRNSGTLINNGTLTNYGTLTNLAVVPLTNYGTLINKGTFTNFFSTFTNFGTFINNSGRLIDNSGTFTNNVGAIFSNNGTFYTTTTFQNYGALMGTGLIQGNVVNSGTIIPGSFTQPMTITGNYAHDAGAVYVVGINAASQSNKLSVFGTATLNGGAVLVFGGSRAYPKGITYTILTATGGVTGTFANITNNFVFLTPSLSYDAQNVYLALLRNSVTHASVATNPNQASVASALDRLSGATGDMQTIMDNIDNLNVADARSAYDQMGGLSHTVLMGATFSALNGYVGVLTGRMGGFVSGGPSMASTQPRMFASRTDVVADIGGALLAAVGGTEGQPEWGFWARGYGNSGERTGNYVSSRYNYGLGGMTVGFDRKITDTFLLGLSTGYSQTKVNMKDLSDKGEISSYQGSIYGAYFNAPWFVDGLVAYGYNRYDTSRDILFGEIARTANAKYAGNAFSVYTEAGYRFKIDSINIIPVAGFQAGYLIRDSFTERDAGALSLNVDGEHTSSFLSSLGVKFRRDFESNAGIFTPELRAKWLHEFSNNDYALNASFAGSPVSTFSVKGDKPNKDSVVLGLGLNYNTKQNLSLFLTYDATLSGDRTEHGGSLGLQYRW